MKTRLFALAALLAALIGGSIAQVTVNCASTNTFVPSCYNLGQFAATTSAQLLSIISDETGSGVLVFATSPTLTTPAIGAATGTSLNISGATNLATAAAAANATVTIGGAPSGNNGSQIKMAQSNSATNWQISTNTLFASALEITPSTAGGGTTFTTPVMYLTGAQTTIANGITASALTVAAGTPSSICQNSATKEITVNAALTCTVSSARFKNTIEAFDGSGLVMVGAMQPDTFFYNDRADRRRLGLIADDLAKIDPRLSEWDEQGRPNSIDFSAMIAVLVKAVQEQQAQIERLQRTAGSARAPSRTKH